MNNVRIKWGVMKDRDGSDLPDENHLLIIAFINCDSVSLSVFGWVTLNWLCPFWRNYMFSLKFRTGSSLEMYCNCRRTLMNQIPPQTQYDPLTLSLSQLTQSTAYISQDLGGSSWRTVGSLNNFRVWSTCLVSWDNVPGASLMKFDWLNEWSCLMGQVLMGESP